MSIESHLIGIRQYLEEIAGQNRQIIENEQQILAELQKLSASQPATEAVAEKPKSKAKSK